MRRTLLDASGAPVGSYDHHERDGAVYADLFEREPGVGVEHAAAVVLAELRGIRIAGDEPLGRALVAAGGRPVRHVHLLSRDLRADPPPPAWTEPPGVRLTDVDRPAADLVEAFRAAYPPGHLDHRDEPPERSQADPAEMLGGRYGPLQPGSGLAIAGDGRVAGAALLGTLPGDPPNNGPWLIELFRDPSHRGVGRPLLEGRWRSPPVPGCPRSGWP